jgi:hypothetical protein
MKTAALDSLESVYFHKAPYGIGQEGTFSQEPSKKSPNQMFYIDFYWTDTLNLADVFWGRNKTGGAVL